MGKPMTNYNKRVDKILYRFAVDTHDSKPGQDETPNFDRAKQAITSLIKELVAEAKPPVIDTPSRTKLYADDEGQMWYDRGQNDAIERYEQNLLKELEEK